MVLFPNLIRSRTDPANCPVSYLAYLQLESPLLGSYSRNCEHWHTSTQSNIYLGLAFLLRLRLRHSPSSVAVPRTPSSRRLRHHRRHHPHRPYHPHCSHTLRNCRPHHRPLRTPVRRDPQRRADCSGRSCSGSGSGDWRGRSCRHKDQGTSSAPGPRNTAGTSHDGCRFPHRGPAWRNGRHRCLFPRRGCSRRQRPETDTLLPRPHYKRSGRVPCPADQSAGNGPSRRKKTQTGSLANRPLPATTGLRSHPRPTPAVHSNQIQTPAPCLPPRSVLVGSVRCTDTGPSLLHQPGSGSRPHHRFFHGAQIPAMPNGCRPTTSNSYLHFPEHTPSGLGLPGGVSGCSSRSPTLLSSTGCSAARSPPVKAAMDTENFETSA